MLTSSLIFQIVGILLSLVLLTIQTIQSIKIWRLKKKSAYIFRKKSNQRELALHFYETKKFHFLNYKDDIFDTYIKNQYKEELQKNILIQSTGSLISAAVAAKKVSEIEFVLKQSIVSSMFAADQLRVLTPTPLSHTAHCQFGCQCISFK